MNKRHIERIFGVGVLASAIVGGVSAWAHAQQGRPAGHVQGKAAESGKEGDEGEIVIKLAEAPEAVRAAAAKVVPADKVTKVIKEEDEGVTTYEIEYQADGMESSAVFSAAGDLMEIEKGIKDSALPAAAAAALNKEYPGGTFGDHVAVQKFYYEVEVTAGGKTHEVKIDAAGDIHDGSKGENHGAKKGEHDENEGDND